MAEKLPDGFGSQEELDKARKLLEREKKSAAREEERRKNDPEYAERLKKMDRLKRAKDKIVLRKAAEAKIVATDQEIEAELKAMEARARK